MSENNLSGITDYQQAFFNNVQRLIRNNYFSKRPKLRILDAGCDPSGKQLRYLANLTRGDMVGSILRKAFPLKKRLKISPAMSRWVT